MSTPTSRGTVDQIAANRLPTNGIGEISAQDVRAVFNSLTASASFRFDNLSDLLDPGAARANIGANNAANITIGTLGIDRVPDLPASKITSGAFDVARVPDLPASKTTSGTFATARIPNLAASKITSGTFDAARIPDLAIAKITGLQTTLDDKADTASLGTAAAQNDDRYAHRANNLSDLANATTARENIGAHDASNLTTGTIADARLPSSQSGKTFTSGITVNGTITGTGVTQSAIDTTSNRLTKTGDFGLGAVASLFGVSSDPTGIEDISGTSFFVHSQGGAPGDAPTTTQGAGIKIGGGSTWNATLWSAIQSNEWYVRSSSSVGPQSDWQRLYHTGNISTIDAPANQIFRVDGTERLRIDSSGNVGIGTSSPQASLDVLSSTSNLAIFERSLSSTAPSLVISNPNANANSGAKLSFREGVATERAFIEYQKGTGTTPSLRFGTADAERLRITSSGNVGIGTSSPGAKLDVDGDARIHGVNAGRGSGAVFTNTVFGRTAFLNNTTGADNTLVGRNAMQANTSGSRNTAVGERALTANTEGVDNTVVGRTALENNTTGEQNTVVGAFALRDNVTGSNNIAIGRAAGNNVTGSNNTIIGSITGTAGMSNTVIIGAGTQERLRIDSSGNVGIGTSSPSVALSVVGTGSYTRGIDLGVDGVDATAYLGQRRSNVETIIGPLTTRMLIGTISDHPVAFLVNNTERLRITSTGNVGIGTSSPGSKLSVVGLPTSDSGLSSGDIWRDGSDLKIVP